MYRKIEPDGTPPKVFEFPQGGKLASDNRWVMMAQLIPWSEFETEYAKNFASAMVAPAKSFRMAWGALIIKEKLGTKTGKHTEFGAKLSASSFEGYVFLDRISWDNFNESGDLIAKIEAFKEFTGYYPESVQVDQIYRTIFR